MYRMKDRKRVIKIITCIGGGILCLLLCMFVCTYGRGARTSSTARENMSRLILGVPDAVCDADSADIIRDYIYAEMEWPFADEFINDPSTLIFESDQPWEDKISELCSDDTIESPGYCYGVAYVLATVYNMLGYKACTLDMAVFDEAENVVNSHVVTLVDLDGRWIVEDATFNLTYLRDGEHLSIQELVESVRTNHTDDIETVHGEHRWRPGMFAEPVYEGEGAYEVKTPQGFTEMKGGGVSQLC